MKRIAGTAAALLAGAALTAPAAMAAAPPNDGFANAELVTGSSFMVAGTNAEATSEAGEPGHRPGGSANHSVWYRWTAPDYLDVTVNTCGSDFDTALAAYTGSAVNALDQLDSDDDSCSTQSEIRFEADAGTTYHFAVDGYDSGYVGNVELELTSVVLPPPPPPGPPEIFYVRTGGTGTDCTQADPCGTIADALTAHRVTSGPGDAIDIGPGTWAEDVDAGTDLDDGLTIHGTLATDGARETAITGNPGPPDDPCQHPCVASIGSGDSDVLLRDIEVNNDDADHPLAGPIFLGGASRLANVFAYARPSSFPTAIVEQADRRSGKVIEDSVLDGRDSGAMAVYGEGGETTITDSQLLGGPKAIQNYGCGCGPNAYRIVRSWIDNADPSRPVLDVGLDVSLDSSLVTGGNLGIGFQGSHGAGWDIVNSTIDVGQPGVADTGSELSLDIANQGVDPIQVDVDSSILVEPIEVFWSSPFFEGTGSVTCTHSDIRANTIAAEWTDDCQPGQNSNVTSDPATLFTGGSPFSWTLSQGSPAIDTGNPAALGPGVSTTDLAGNPRVVPATAATCPDGIRDKGAYERAAVDCPTPPPPPPPAEEQTLTVSTTGSGAGTVTGDGIDCGGEGHTDCAETVADGTQITLTATAGANSGFAGFSGDCAESPCTVVMDADRSVDAAFAPNGEPDTWFVNRPRRPWHSKPIFTMRTWPHDSPLECKVDDEPYEPCSAKVKLRGLEPGRHVFRARSFAFGEFDPSPAKKAFRIPR